MRRHTEVIKERRSILEKCMDLPRKAGFVEQIRKIEKGFGSAEKTFTFTLAYRKVTVEHDGWDPIGLKCEPEEEKPLKAV